MAPSTAYILINCERGFEEETIKELEQLPETVEVHQIYGDSYDLVAKVNAETPISLKKTISSHIRKISKINSTSTLIAIEGQSFL